MEQRAFERDKRLAGWLSGDLRHRRSRLAMLCLPYAGGQPLIFKEWQAQMPDDVAVMPIHLPGRGRRMTEQPYTDMKLLVDDLAAAVKPLLRVPFVIFGHSMGALIGFELAQRLKERYGLTPQHLFVSAFEPPSLPRAREKVDGLTDKALISKLRLMDGTPQEILRDREMLELFLPVMRADLQLLDGYRYERRPPLECPITAFGGTDDREVPIDRLYGWRDETSRALIVEPIVGNHFFINTNQTLLERIRVALDIILALQEGSIH